MTTNGNFFNDAKLTTEPATCQNPYRNFNDTKLTVELARSVTSTRLEIVYQMERDEDDCKEDGTFLAFIQMDTMNSTTTYSKPCELQPTYTTDSKHSCRIHCQASAAFNRVYVIVRSKLNPFSLCDVQTCPINF